MKRFQLLNILFFVLGLIVSACAGESDPEAKLDRFKSAESFHVINDVGGVRASSEVSVMDDVHYEFAFNDDKRLVTFTIRNFRMTDDESPVDYTFVDVPWVYSVGTPEVQRVIDAAFLMPTSPRLDLHAFTDLHIVYSEPKASSVYGNSGVVASYTVNNVFRVRAYPYSVVGEGTTVCFNKATGRSRICYSTAVAIRFNPHARSADVDVLGLLPDDAHGAVSFSLQGITAEFVDNGYALSCPVRVIDVDGVAVDSFHGVAELSDELDLTFGLRLDDGSEYDVECHLSPNLAPQSR